MSIAEFQHRVSGEAGAQGRGDILIGPVDHVDQGLPEGLVAQLRSGDIGAGDDQGIESLGLDLIQGFVILIDMRLSLLAAWQIGDGERVQIKLRDLIAFTDQAKELALGGLQRGIGHHVQQADV